MEPNEYQKPSRNLVAKHCRKFNRYQVERDRKKDKNQRFSGHSKNVNSRKGKEKWNYSENDE